ncbi:MAG: type II toxin-antitoxin system VapC family toxin [Betaproteobacteria bacterium]
MNTFVIDASVAVRWVVDLPFASEARSFLSFQNRLIAPDFLPAEVGSALTKLVRAGSLSQADGVEAYEDFFRAPVRLYPAHPIALTALKTALKQGRSFYDCLYLTLAESEGGRFVTADAVFYKAMKGTPHAKHTHFIGQE